MEKDTFIPVRRMDRAPSGSTSARRLLMERVLRRKEGACPFAA